MAKGYSQKYVIDYTEIFAPVARLDTVRMIIALTAKNGWKVFSLMSSLSSFMLKSLRMFILHSHKVLKSKVKNTSYIYIAEGTLWLKTR